MSNKLLSAESVKLWSKPALAAVLMIVGGILLERNYAEHYQRGQELFTLQQLNTIRARLDGEVNSNISLIHGMVAKIALNPGLSQQEFAQTAAYFLQLRPRILNIAGIRNLVISHAYPLQGNEATIGIDLRELPSQRDAALRAKETGLTVLAGPVELIQGGRGFISRTPVFLPADKANIMTANNRGEFWGLVSIVISAGDLYQQVGLLAPELPLNIAIRGRDGMGAQGEVFYGDPDLFNTKIVTLEVNLPGGGSWQLAGSPKSGWQIPAQQLWIFRTGCLLLILLVGFLIFSKSRGALQRQLAEQEARQRDAFFRAYFESDMLGMSITSPDKQWVIFNDELCRMLGYSRTELASLNWADLTHPDDLSKDEVLYQRMLNGEIEQYSMDKRYIRKNGEPLDIHLDTKCLRNSDGSIEYCLAASYDISGRKRNERIIQSLLESTSAAIGQDFFHTLVRHLSQDLGVCHVYVGELDDHDKNRIHTKAVWSNDAHQDNFSFTIEHSPVVKLTTQHFYYCPQRVQEQFPQDSMLADWQAESYSAAALFDRHGAVIGVLAIADTRPLTELELFESILSIIAARAGSELERGRTAENLSEALQALQASLKKAQQDSFFHSYFDPLTELPNRPHCLDSLAKVILQSRRSGKLGAVFFIDLDRFKHINDSLGHDLGNQLLQAAGQRLKSCIRASDTIAHFGGDEFVAILSELGEEVHATILAETLLKKLAEPFYIAEHEIYTTASIGITLFPNDADDAATLLQNADMAMSQSKQYGRNTFQFFTQEMTERAQHFVRLEKELRRALEQDELLVYFQPVYSLSDDQVIGAEALVRWNHPQRGIVSPGEFIDVAEETGLIVDIGERVLNMACQEMQTCCNSAQNSIYLAVNVSSRQFKRNFDCDLITEILQQSGFPANRLVLEITESILVEEDQRITRTLEQLRALQIGLSVDDFGTGYSSLSYLQRFPVTLLKIDRSFVRNMDNNQNDARLVETIIAMAKGMNLRVTAEGVEKPTQLALLKELQCDAIQGFLLGYPMPPEEFAKLIQHQIS